MASFLRSLRLQHIMWTFGAYLVVWVGVSISILHVLEVDYHSSLSSFLPLSQSTLAPPHHQHQPTKKSVDDEFAAFYNFSKCFRQVDYGLVDTITPQVVCDSSKRGTTITRLPSTNWPDGSLWEQFALDFTGSSPVISPIQHPSEEGGHHDPRYILTPTRVHCNCALDAAGYDTLDRFFPSNSTAWHCDATLGAPSTYTTSVDTTAILMARKDDHNPFFQLAAALTAWTLVKQRLGATPTQLFILDDGVPMQTDTLLQKLLAPHEPVRYGRDVVGTSVYFAHAIFLPFEFAGPLVEHLDDEQLCLDSQLVVDFRDDVFRAFDLPLNPHPHVHNTTADPSSVCHVTIISRRAYAGRDIARMWLNEDEIVGLMQAKYPMCTFKSVDFATKTMAEQIALIASSRVVIGMHGAGMANVAFAAPNTFVVEIFPLSTFRFGYRNLCQYLGLHYLEFRDGVDTPWPEQHKTVLDREWFKRFDLVMKVVLNEDEKATYDGRASVQKRIHRQHVMDKENSDE
ncbi:Aste57867_12954 [Aphanomyces stellatus]|uniref:Aste57867_12954 protein n=1 Tax=Aphanomyces stellatus TaxID=120398 RepID=A0A485KXD4_9STRA|nr:hypothetical protein As57867_012906 [Aphanomyces stellatus]VFT89800.1 Aste57867_12954 [Aphanomyces stellatus]